MNLASPFPRASVRHRARGTVGWLAAVLMLAGATPSSAATSLAVFPSGGSAGAEARLTLDAAVRKAVGNDDAFDLLSAAETAENVEFMAESGAPCTPADVGCLQKFGLVATVDLVLVAEARGRKTLDVSFRLIDVGSGEVVRTIDGAVQPRDLAAVAKLVGRALHGDDLGDDSGDDSGTESGDDSGTGSGGVSRRERAGRPSTTEGSSSTADGDHDAAAEGGPGRRTVGLWAAAVGGGVGGLALLGALGGEAVFWTGTGSKDARADLVRPFAQTMWVVMLAGAAAAGVGGRPAAARRLPGVARERGRAGRGAVTPPGVVRCMHSADVDARAAVATMTTRGPAQS